MWSRLQSTSCVTTLFVPFVAASIFNTATHCYAHCNRHTLSSETISTPSPLFLSLLSESIVVCYRKCGNMMKLQDYTAHLNNHCRSHHANNSPSKVTLKDILSNPSTSPATPVECQAAQHLVSRLMQ